jgi:nucleoside-diphosphate-sugar epimerase
MKVLATGLTGAIGPATLRALLAAGHDVRAVARTDEKAARLRAAGAEPVVVDVFDPEALRRAVAGSDAILHLATNVPPMRKMALPIAWRTHNRLRTEVTASLLDAARTHGIGRVVKESITFVYPDRGDEWIDESVEPEVGRFLEPTIEGERMVAELNTHGSAGVVLRFGLFYGADNRGTDEMLRLARLRMTQLAGRPDSYMSSIHLDDVGSAVAAALDVEGGVYNVVDDEPLTRRAYADAFADAFGFGHLRIAPGALLRLTAGSSAKALTASQRVSNRKFRDAAGWAPVMPNARDGWAVIAAARGVKSTTEKEQA